MRLAKEARPGAPPLDPARASGGARRLAFIRGAFALLVMLLLAMPAVAQIGPRVVKLTQVDARNNVLGQTVDIYCPASGCQEPLSLTFEQVEERFVASIEVVGRGIYLALQSRALGIAQIVEFGRGAPGPAFIGSRGRVRAQAILRYAILRDASVRADRGPDASSSVTTGNFYTRKRQPDIYLRVEVSAPEG